jgi:hypothetical protein
MTAWAKARKLCAVVNEYQIAPLSTLQTRAALSFTRYSIHD